MTQEEARERKLHCMGGAAPPPELDDGWKALEAIPSGASGGFWELLGEFIAQPGHPSHDSLLEEFCRTSELEGASVIRAIAVCDRLLTLSAALDLPDTPFQEDVETLAGGKTLPGVELIRRYAAVRPMLRRRIVEETLADHGRVLVGLDWRLDRVEASDRGTKLNAGVVFLTLDYREQDQIKRISLQLVPESIQLLKSFTDRFGGQG